MTQETPIADFIYDPNMTLPASVILLILSRTSPHNVAKWDEKKKQEELELVTPKFIGDTTGLQNNSYQNAVIGSGDYRNNTLEIQPEVPNNFIGYGKRDTAPYNIFRIYYQNNKKFICQGQWCKSDGIPPTDEEIRIQEDLLTSGHKSRYYQKDDYWKYHKPMSDTKAA